MNTITPTHHAHTPTHHTTPPSTQESYADNLLAYAKQQLYKDVHAILANYVEEPDLVHIGTKRVVDIMLLLHGTRSGAPFAMLNFYKAMTPSDFQLATIQATQMAVRRNRECREAVCNAVVYGDVEELDDSVIADAF